MLREHRSGWCLALRESALKWGNHGVGGSVVLPFVFLFKGKGPVEEQNFKMKVRFFLGIQKARECLSCS